MITIRESSELTGGPMEYTPVYGGSPNAPVRLVKDGRYFQWEIIRCPYCEGTHRHNVDGKSPRKYLGGRMAHCHPDMHVDHDVLQSLPIWNGDAEYRLIEIEGKPSKAELDEHFPTVLGSELEPLHISQWTENTDWNEQFQAYTVSRRDISPRIPLTPEVKDHVWIETDGHCSYCGVQLRPFSTFTIDHVEPVAKGGTNALNNLVAACRSCNSIKGDRGLTYLRQRLGVISFWFEQKGGNA